MFCNLDEIIKYIKTGKKIYLAQKIKGFVFYFLIDNEDKANKLFKDLNDQEKIRFISAEHNLNKQNISQNKEFSLYHIYDLLDIINQKI